MKRQSDSGRGPRRRAARESLLSAVYDREIASESLPEELAARSDRELSWFARLSEAMRVPEDVAREDPNFVARFRARRDAVSEVLAPGRGWRWLTIRLVPLAAAAVVVAGFVLSIPTYQRPDAFTELEVREIGDGLVDLAKDDLAEEPVLRIALGDL